MADVTFATYDYAILRVVPRVERGEFVNVGVIVSCAGRRFLEARFEVDPIRLAAVDPFIDLESVESHLASVARICQGGEAAGPIGKLTQRERFHWLVSPRSALIQTSPVHTGRCHDLSAALDRLMVTMVHTPGQRHPNDVLSSTTQENDTP